jgi:hypothetical protein
LSPHLQLSSNAALQQTLAGKSCFKLLPGLIISRRLNRGSQPNQGAFFLTLEKVRA